jgi:hypothetical protein
VEATRVCAGAAILASGRAEAELAELYRERDIQRAGSPRGVSQDSWLN